MAPMVHLVSYTQSNLFGSQTPMSHPENREARTLLPSNQWTITTLDKLNQYCSKYWTLRWWKNTQSHVHNSLTLSFLRLSCWVGPACVLMISRVLLGGRGQCAETPRRIHQGWFQRGHSWRLNPWSLEPPAHFGSTDWLGVSLWSWVPSPLVSGQGSLKLMKSRWLGQHFLIKRSSSQGTPWSVLPLPLITKSLCGLCLLCLPTFLGLPLWGLFSLKVSFCLF